MTWQAFELDKPFVTQALKNGDFDYMEVVGTVEETEFFRLLLGQGVLEKLAADYPSPRQKEEVPVWLYLASELTLRLHGAMGFGAYPYVLHCGGLLRALGPRQVEHKRDPDSGECRPVLRGYNHKNHYARATPCDRDFLRKMAKDTRPQALQDWFGTSVVRQYQALDAFDPEGIFLIDGTYLFVPLDNDRYEHSSRLRFDPDGRHPITQKQFDALPLKQQQQCQWRRCYRAVTLSHTTRGKDYSLRCGTNVLPGKAAEVLEVWPVVKRFVEAVGRGVMRLLVFDRGLIDGKTVSRLKELLEVDSLFPLKKGMDLWEDAKVLAREDGQPWERSDRPPPEPVVPPPDRPESVARREAARQKTLHKRRAKAEAEAEPEPPARRLEWIEYKAIEPSQVWESCSVPVNVLLIRNHYANGDELDWALACTKEFPQPLEMWRSYQLRPAVEEDHRQEKCFWDLTHFRTPAFSLVVNRVVFVELAYSLIQIFLRQVGREELVGQTRQRLLDSLLPTQNRIALYYQQRFGLFESYEYQVLLLSLREGARRKALGKTRRLHRAQLRPPELPRRGE